MLVYKLILLILKSIIASNSIDALREQLRNSLKDIKKPVTVLLSSKNTKIPIVENVNKSIITKPIPKESNSSKPKVPSKLSLVKLEKPIRIKVPHLDFLNPSECKIENFMFCDELGKGTFGIVNKVFHLKSQKYYVAKKLTKPFFDEKGIQVLHRVNNLINELIVLEDLKDPIIAKFHCIMVHDNSLIQIFDYIPGMNFLEFQKKIKDEVTRDDYRVYALEMIHGLKYLEKMQISWKDLKPDNIIVDNDDHLKFIDFGIAESFKGHEQSNLAYGPIHYSSPERLKVYYGLSASYELRPSDWWSLGCFLYRFFQGKVPFEFDLPKNNTKEEYDKLFKVFEKEPQCLHPAHIPPGGLKASDIPKECIGKVIPTDPSRIIRRLLNPNSKERMKFVNTILQDSWFTNPSILGKPCKKRSKLENSEQSEKLFKEINSLLGKENANGSLNSATCDISMFAFCDNPDPLNNSIHRIVHFDTGRIYLAKFLLASKYFFHPNKGKSGNFEIIQKKFNNLHRQISTFNGKRIPFVNNLLCIFPYGEHLVQIFEYTQRNSLAEIYRPYKNTANKIHPSRPKNVNGIKFHILELIHHLKYLKKGKISWGNLKPENIVMKNGHLIFREFETAKSFEGKFEKYSDSRIFLGYYTPPEAMDLKAENDPNYMPKRFDDENKHGPHHMIGSLQSLDRRNLHYMLEPLDWYSLGCLIYEMVFFEAPFFTDWDYKYETLEKNRKNILKNIKSGPYCLKCLSKIFKNRKIDDDGNVCRIVCLKEPFNDSIGSLKHPLNLISGLLQSNPIKRMKFVKNIGNHPWFKEEGDSWLGKSMDKIKSRFHLLNKSFDHEKTCKKESNSPNSKLIELLKSIHKPEKYRKH